MVFAGKMEIGKFSVMDGRDRITEDLRALVARQSQEIAALQQQAAELQLALAKANKDSSTSSQPPSSDIRKPKTSKNRDGAANRNAADSRDMNRI
jgi:hypothetical protein